jgi:uncharacterized membrane protein YphA (DoxX/SURF4 family)
MNVGVEFPARSRRSTRVGAGVASRERIRIAWPWLAVAARLVLGGVWLAAGVTKIGDPEGSVRAVRAYQLVPDPLERTVGYALPLLEICLGILLVIGLAQRLAAIASAVLLVGFVMGISAAWARGLQIECGCFGGGGAASGEDVTAAYKWDIARDIGLLVLAGLLAWRPTSRLSVDRLLYPDVRTSEKAEVS